MNHVFQPENAARFEAALRRFDEENTQDPNQVEINGLRQPYELVYSMWLTEWVLRLAPEASEELRLAARCQHLRRWMIPRSSYPMTRPGYLQWRQELKKFHAERAGNILREVGYPEERIARVKDLVLKRLFPQDPESRVLEDALCLVFLERQFGELVQRTSEEKMINAVQKTWRKMTPAAHEVALKLAFTPVEKALLERALEA